MSLQGLLQPSRRKDDLDQTREVEAAEGAPAESVVDEPTVDEDAAYRARLLKYDEHPVYFGIRLVKNGLTIRITEVMSNVFSDLTSPK